MIPLATLMCSLMEELRAQSPQALHFEVSMVGFSSEKRDRKPRTVPTGQTVLQYVRPLRHARMPRIISVADATPRVIHPRSHISTL